MMAIFVVVMVTLGMILGSFAACQVRRMRWREEGGGNKFERECNAVQAGGRGENEQNWRKRDTAQTNRPEKQRVKLDKRSICMHCGRKLRWYDNIPVVSWLMLRGRCRDCGAEIGKMEILSEVGLGMVLGVVGASFWGLLGEAGVVDGAGLLWASSDGLSAVGSSYDLAMRLGQGATWWGQMGLTILEFILLIMMVAGLWMLLLYDAMWGRMPVKVLTFCVICGIMYRLGCFLAIFLTGVDGASSGVGEELMGEIWSLAGVVLILAGTYYLLYKVSRERWVGGGDWILCLGLAFLLGEWWLGLVMLFLANFLGCLVMLPMMRRQARSDNGEGEGMTRDEVERNGEELVGGKAEQGGNNDDRDDGHEKNISSIKGHQIPFGPFLVVAGLVVYCVQGWLMGLVAYL